MANEKNPLKDLGEALRGIGTALEVLSAPQGRVKVKNVLASADKRSAASTLDDLEEIVEAAAKIGAKQWTP